MKLIFNTLLIVCISLMITSNLDAQEYQTTPSGLKYKVTHKTRGVKANHGDQVSVHYKGMLTDSTEFDSSFKRNKPFVFKLGAGRVIKGWDEGIALLHQGEKATFIIPAELAYGSQDRPNIPANSTLIFDVELVKVIPAVKIEAFDTKGKDTLTTMSGLKYIIVKEGEKDAIKATEGSTVSVHYSGYLEDGKMFDSSVQRGKPISFPLGTGRVIKGWDEGVALMKVGDKMRLIIPYQLAYGEKGRPGTIPPKAELTFDVELVDATAPLLPYDVAGKDTLKTKSGLKYIIVEEGKGKQTKFSKNVTVHYTGYLNNGTIFDSSVQRGKPFSFLLGLGKVIKGWDEGVALMKQGSKYRLIVPHYLGYGSRAMGKIPANSELIFDVEVIDVGY